MTKTILVMVITATLILATFALGNNADAYQPDAIASIKTNAATAICTTPEVESCGIGTAKAKFQQLVTNVDENGNTIGVARGQIILQGTGEVDGIVQNVGPLSFQYDAENNLLSMEGDGQYQDGEDPLTIKVVSSNFGEFKNNKAKIELDLRIIDPTGRYVIAVEGLKGIVTETTPIQVQPGDLLFLKGHGPILCEGGVECGTAKTQIDMEVESTTQFTYDALGNIKLELKFKKDTDDDGVVSKVLHNQEPLSYTYDAVGNRLTSSPSFVYDENGNRYGITTQFEYDQNDRLKTDVEGTINLLAPNDTRFKIPILGSWGIAVSKNP